MTVMSFQISRLNGVSICHLTLCNLSRRNFVIELQEVIARTPSKYFKEYCHATWQLNYLKVLKLCFLSPVATDGMDGNGLKFEKNWPIFFMLRVPKFLMVSRRLKYCHRCWLIRSSCFYSIRGFICTWNSISFLKPPLNELRFIEKDICFVGTDSEFLVSWHCSRIAEESLERCSLSPAYSNKRVFPKYSFSRCSQWCNIYFLIFRIFLFSYCNLRELKGLYNF